MDSLAQNLRYLEKLARCCDRLRDIAADPRIVASGDTVIPYVSFTKDITAGLSSALQELAELLQLNANEPIIPADESVLQEITSSVEALNVMSPSYKRSPPVLKL